MKRVIIPFLLILFLILSIGVSVTPTYDPVTGYSTCLTQGYQVIDYSGSIGGVCVFDSNCPADFYRCESDGNSYTRGTSCNYMGFPPICTENTCTLNKVCTNGCNSATGLCNPAPTPTPTPCSDPGIHWAGPPAMGVPSTMAGLAQQRAISAQKAHGNI